MSMRNVLAGLAVLTLVLVVVIALKLLILG